MTSEKTIQEQNEKFSKVENKKEPNRKFGAEEYNDWTKEQRVLTLDLTKLKRESVSYKQVIWNYPIRRAKRKKRKKAYRTYGTSYKRNKAHITGVPEGDEREKGEESLFKE